MNKAVEHHAASSRRIALPGAAPVRGSRAAAWARRWSLWGVLALALWAPFPFGSARPWAAGLLAIVAGIIVMGRGVADLALAEEEPTGTGALMTPALLFALVIAWAVMQCLPAVPSSWQHPLWAEAQSLLSAPASASVGLDASATRGALLHLLADAALFWLGFRVAQRPEEARALLVGIAAIGALYAGWGLIVYGTGNRTVLWFDKWAYPNDLTSTFVNRNSF